MITALQTTLLSHRSPAPSALSALSAVKPAPAQPQRTQRAQSEELTPLGAAGVVAYRRACARAWAIAWCLFAAGVVTLGAVCWGLAVAGFGQ